MWTSKNTSKLIEDLHSLPCLWDVQSAEYKNRNEKVDACDTLATKYGVSAVEAEKKIQALKTQFCREHKKLVDSKRSGSSARKAVWFGYEPLLFLLQGHDPGGSRIRENAQVSFKSCITFFFAVLINTMDDKFCVRVRTCIDMKRILPSK
jgi:hypothetical protein